MNRKSLEHHQRLLQYMSNFPKYIMTLEVFDNIPDFILYGLCHDDCFNVRRAAYFIDNPDFDFIQGISGFCKSEVLMDWDKLWDQPDQFSSKVKDSSFNKRIKSFSTDSIKRNNHSHDEFIKRVAYEIGFDEPCYYCWDLKHYNHGIIVYEKIDVDSEHLHDHFKNYLHLLNFCPIR